MADSEDEADGHNRLKLKDAQDEDDAEEIDAEKESDDIDKIICPDCGFELEEDHDRYKNSASTKYAATNAARYTPYYQKKTHPCLRFSPIREEKPPRTGLSSKS